MKKIISILLSLQIIIFPAYVCANEPKTQFLKKGNRAPYDGIIINDIAQAKMIAEKKEKERICNLEKKYLKMRQDADCKLQSDLMKINLNSLQNKHNSLMEIKKEEIKKLNKIILSKSETKMIWWVGLGFLGGIVVTVGSFLLVAQVRKVN